MHAYGGSEATPIASTQYCWKVGENPFWGEEVKGYQVGMHLNTHY